MSLLNLLLLVVLSAIWGSSFIFMRILSPLLGPLATTDLRLLIAGAFLLLLFAAGGYKLEWRRHGRHFLVIGLVNSAVPFFLYSFAALHIPASLSVILNSLSPMFGAVFSAIWLHERLTLQKSAGIVLGISGVGLIGSLGNIRARPLAVLAALACVTAAMLYALAGVYIKKYAGAVPARAIAAGSQFSLGLLGLPLVFLFPPAAPLTLRLGAIVVVFAVLCSALAYLIYYKLIAEAGPTKALTVTFLMPAFGMAWGRLLLGEAITTAMLAGAALILCGTWLIVAKKSRL